MSLKEIIIIFFAIVICNCAYSQTIKVGDKFFDGECLYTCREIRMGKIVYFTGVDYIGDWRELTLKHISKRNIRNQAKCS
mgnify:CR=1 FL=1